MPNIGHKWTPAEERAAATLVWDEFTLRFPGVSRSAYRQRRATLLQDTELPDGETLSGLSSLERAIANNVKLARSVIRLRHSIDADDELSAAIPRIRTTLQAQAQTGSVTGLSYDDLRVLIYGQ